LLKFPTLGIFTNYFGLFPSVQQRNEVLVTIEEWLIGGGAQHILDDIQLYNAMLDHSFLKATVFDASPVQKVWESRVEMNTSVVSTFELQTLRRPNIST